MKNDKPSGGQNKADREATISRNEAYFCVCRSDEMRSDKGMQSYGILNKKEGK